MASKPQTESEQPAKVYQLDALAQKLESIGKQLDTVVKQTAGLVTSAQLEAVKTDYKEKIGEAIKDIHAEYRPSLRRNKALWGLVGVLVVAIVGQAILISSLRK